MTRRTILAAALVGGCAALLLTASTAPAGTGPVRVQRVISFSEDSGASTKVKDECDLETKVPSFLSSYAKNVELVDGKPGKSGRVLELRITQVRAPGGGVFSGAKSMTVSGTLWEDGKELGSFTAERYSGGGAFGAYKGTCGIIGRCAKAIGKDIAKWLKKPVMGARLGDA